MLKFQNMMDLEVGMGLNAVDLREVRIVLQGTGYVIEIIYRKGVMDEPHTMKASFLGQ